MGIRDRDWQDIYEGDIVKFYTYKTNWLISVVSSIGSDFTIQAAKDTVYLKDFIIDPKHPEHPIQWIEVLGNIYENPEVLNSN